MLFSSLKPTLVILFLLAQLTFPESGLFLFQVRYPDRITLIRGNHESRQITQVKFLDFTVLDKMFCFCC